MAWYNSTKDLGKSVRSLGGSVFGDRDDAGIFGTGQFKTKEHKVDDKAFQSDEVAQRQKEFAKALGQNKARSGVMMNTAPADQWRGRQNKLADQLQGQIEGRGPSVAEMQMQRGLNQSLANQNSQVASMRGLNPALAFRAVQNNAATQNQEMLGNQGMLRAQETAQARGELGNLSNAARQQDLSTASANQASQMSQRGMNDQQDRFYREGQMTMDERNRQAQIAREQLKSNNALGAAQINAGAYNNAAMNRAGAIGGLSEGLGGMSSIMGSGGGGGGGGGGIASIAGTAASVGAMMSDRNIKTDIKPVTFDSPANWGFQVPPMPDSGGDDHFEPTVENAEKMSGDEEKKDYSKGSESSSNFQAMGKGIGQLLMSDETQKTDKKSADLGGFLDALKGYSFKYKDPQKHGEGEQVGVMAQDMEKTPIGEKLVVDTPEGKVIDYGKAGGVIMASQAMLNQRIGDLEKMFQARAKKRSA